MKKFFMWCGVAALHFLSLWFTLAGALEAYIMGVFVASAILAAMFLMFLFFAMHLLYQVATGEEILAGDIYRVTED